MPFPCRPRVSRDIGPWSAVSATRRRWELVLKDSLLRLLSFAPGHIQARASRQSQQLCRPCQAAEFYASVCKLIACYSSRYPVFRRMEKDFHMTFWITPTPLTLGMNRAGVGGGPSQSNRRARSIGLLFPLRIAANPQRFLRQGGSESFRTSASNFRVFSGSTERACRISFAGARSM